MGYEISRGVFGTVVAEYARAGTVHLVAAKAGGLFAIDAPCRGQVLVLEEYILYVLPSDSIPISSDGELLPEKPDQTADTTNAFRKAEKESSISSAFESESGVLEQEYIL
ncbi:MAG: hypothetical protein EOO39_22870 [Cytophagaceae bacterium]|nr:MAG: hypothetical protein EOO39_22870 [Cytophagaceae bacterium]